MIFNMGPQELVIIGVLAVMLFGSRLPEVARSLGGSYREFRKSLSEMQSQLRFDDDTSTGDTSSSNYADDYDAYEPPTVPKFEPPTSEPTTEEA